MLIWGYNSKYLNLGIKFSDNCQSCGGVQDKRLILYYRYAHLYYYFRVIYEKQYLIECDFCGCFYKVSTHETEKLNGPPPIPFMDKYGALVLCGFVVMFFFGLLLL